MHGRRSRWIKRRRRANEGRIRQAMRSPPTGGAGPRSIPVPIVFVVEPRRRGRFRAVLGIEMGLAPEAPALARVALDEIVEDGMRRPLVEALVDQPPDDDVLEGVEPSLAVGPAGILRDDEVQRAPGRRRRAPAAARPSAARDRRAAARAAPRCAAGPASACPCSPPSPAPPGGPVLPGLTCQIVVAGANAVPRQESDFSRVVTQTRRSVTLVHGSESHQRKSR